MSQKSVNFRKDWSRKQLFNEFDRFQSSNCTARIQFTPIENVLRQSTFNVGGIGFVVLARKALPSSVNEAILRSWCSIKTVTILFESGGFGLVSYPSLAHHLWSIEPSEPSGPFCLQAALGNQRLFPFISIDHETRCLDDSLLSTPDASLCLTSNSAKPIASILPELPIICMVDNSSSCPKQGG